MRDIRNRLDAAVSVDASTHDPLTSLSRDNDATPVLTTAKKPLSLPLLDGNVVTEARKKITRAAEPTKIFFDPWNSASTGHQTAPNRLSGSTSWRDSRGAKLAAQYQAGQAGGGGTRIFDSVGAGSEHWGKDGRKENGDWERGASGLRGKGQRSIIEALRGAKQSKAGVRHAPGSSDGKVASGVRGDDGNGDEGNEYTLKQKSEVESAVKLKQEREKKIFRNLTVYVNGSTAPLISDHKLKYLLVEHGARVSFALGRRSVTHVILGTSCGQSSSRGAGGGLASGKIEKEISRVGGKGIKFVSPEWVVQSVKAGKRLPESQFAGLRLAPKAQRSALAAFGRLKDRPDPG